MAKQRKSEHSIPYIYGYRTFERKAKKGFKDIVLQGKGGFDQLLQNAIDELGSDVYSIDLANTEREQARKGYEQFLILALSGWLTVFLVREIYEFLFTSERSAYELGIADGKRKMIEAISRYRGQHENDKSRIIKGIRNYDLSLPISEAEKIRATLEQDIDSFSQRFVGQYARDGSAILVKTRLTEEEKISQLRKLSNRHFKENRAGSSLLGYRNTALVTLGMVYLYDAFSPQYVRWVVNAPIDTPCVMSAGEIVRYGTPFSNGFIKPQAHKSCQCSLEVVNIGDSFMERLLKRF